MAEKPGKNYLRENPSATKDNLTRILNSLEWLKIIPSIKRRKKLHGVCAPKQKYGLEKGAHNSTRDCKNVEKTKQMETTIRQITNRKKRDLYSVICVCENDFCTFKKSEEG